MDTVEELLQQIKAVIKKLEMEYGNEINSGIIQMIYKSYIDALCILKNGENIHQINIIGGVRAYLDSYNDYYNPLLGEMYKAEKLNKKLLLI